MKKKNLNQENKKLKNRFLNFKYLTNQILKMKLNIFYNLLKTMIK